MKDSQRWMRLILATVALLLAGIIYAWSYLKPPLAELYGWDARGSQLQLNYTLTLCFFCLGGLVSGLLAKKLGIKVRMLIGGLLVFVGLFIVSKLDGKSAFMLYLGYGIMCGTGIGFVYNTIIATTNAWFPDKKGICSGCMMLGFGFSAMVLGTVATKLFSTNIGWRGTYLTYGIVIGGLLVLIGFALRLPKEGEVPAKALRSAGTTTDYDTKGMLKRASFWYLFALCTIMGAVGSTAIGDAKNFITDIDANAVALASLGAGMISVCNGAGRLIAGTLFDKIGLRKTQYINSALLTAAPLAMLIAIWTKSTAIAFTGLCLCGLAFSFAPTVTTTFTLAFYGQKNFAVNFPVLTLTLIPASFAATIAGGLSSSATYIVLLVIAVIGSLINLMIKKA